jgi:diacylglycerol O-acyltransferase
MSPGDTVTPRPERRTRALVFDPVMSAAETIMWKVDGDPWLRPVAGSLAILDQPVDFELFERRMRVAVAAIPRLRERVVAGPGPLSPPGWAPDADFDLSHHLRHVAMPRHASLADLLQLVSHLYEDPFDPTRPLWEFVVIDGVDSGGALFWKIHHTISDGEGLVRLSERYMEPQRHAPMPPDVDLDALVRAAVQAAAPVPESSRRAAGLLLEAARRSVAAGWLPVVASRRVVAAATLAALDPARVVEAADGIYATARGVAGQIGGASSPNGSSLWTGRSSRRHLESVRVPLEAARKAGKALGGSINDVFVTGAVNGVLAYHAKRDAPVPHLNFSFVVSQRSGGSVGGNFFTPLRVQVPGDPASAAERFATVRDRMAERRTSSTESNPVANLARLAQVLPASLLRRAGRAQVSGVDFATSNMRGAPFPLYISGARVLYTSTLGPVAGTAFNLTTVSYDGSLDMGLFVDPVAVEDPEGLRSSLEEAYADLLIARPSGRGHRT